MNIEKAKQLKPGDIVHCPADRGELGYSGKIESIGTTEYRTHNGSVYLWVTVRQRGNKATVWPSNRLS